MLSWFMSPAVSVQSTDPALPDGDGVAGVASGTAIASGFHPIHLPPSSAQESSTSLQPAQPSAYEATVDTALSSRGPSPGLFGGLELNARGSRRRLRQRVSPASLSLHAPQREDAESGDRRRVGDSLDGGATGESTYVPPSVFAFLSPQTVPVACSTQMAGDAGPVREAGPTYSVEDGSLDHHALRDRVEAFSREYNPSLLPDVPSMLERFAGRGQELLCSLANTYGPEQTGLQASALTGARTVPGTDARRTSDDAAPEVPLSESGLSAFRFLHPATAVKRVLVAPASGSPPTLPEAYGAVEVADSLTAAVRDVPTEIDARAGDRGGGEAIDVCLDAAETLEGLQARQTSELRRIQSGAAAARDRLASAMRTVAELVRGRSVSAGMARSVEHELSAAVTREDYGRAEELSKRVVVLVAEVQSATESIAAAAASLPSLQEEMETHVAELAALPLSWRAELDGWSREWSRRLGEVVDADEAQFNVAVRLMKSAERQAAEAEHQSVAAMENGAAQRERIRADVERSTAEMRARRDSAAAAEVRVAEEIGELERRLESLRGERERMRDEAECITRAIAQAEAGGVAALQSVEAGVGVAEERLAAARRAVRDARESTETAQAALEARRAAAAGELDRVRAYESEVATVEAQVNTLTARTVPSARTLTAGLARVLAEWKRPGAPSLPSLSEVHTDGTTLGEQIAKAEAMLAAVAAKEGALRASVSDVRESITLQEAAKAAAVAGKQFKLAQEKAMALRDAQVVLSEQEAQLREVVRVHHAQLEELQHLQLAQGQAARRGVESDTVVREEYRDLLQTLRALASPSSGSRGLCGQLVFPGEQPAPDFLAEAADELLQSLESDLRGAGCSSSADDKSPSTSSASDGEHL